MGVNYRMVYQPPTPEQVRDEAAARLRRQYATPRPLPPVGSVIEPTVKPQASPAQRAAALARYDTLIREGVDALPARLAVEAEQGVNRRTLLDWIMARQQAAPPKPTLDRVAILARYDALAAANPDMSVTDLRRQIGAEAGVSYKTVAVWVHERKHGPSARYRRKGQS